MKGRADAIDFYVGERLRQAREKLILSQAYLGNSVGVSFQQIQKYERGTNRISASMLARLAYQLGVSIAYFYEGLPSELLELNELFFAGPDPSMPKAVYDLELRQLIAAFRVIASKKERKSVIFLCETLARLAPIKAPAVE